VAHYRCRPTKLKSSEECKLSKMGQANCCQDQSLRPNSDSLVIMIEVRYTDIAKYDLVDVKSIITKYFMQWNDSVKASKQLDMFEKELIIQETNIGENPKMYPVRYEVVFDGNIIPVRYFSVHWFTVFYSFSDQLVTIWFIRSSKSDFSKFINRTS
jgi:hypothetical protein